MDFLSQLQSFNVLNEVIDGLDTGSETPVSEDAIEANFNSFSF